jgi:hypothetical protein
MVDSLAALGRVMDFQSAMETFAEAWVAANVTQVNILAYHYIVTIECEFFVSVKN